MVKLGRRIRNRIIIRMDNFLRTLLLVSLPVFANDNIITIEQTGDTFEFGVDQIGYGNKVLMLDNNSYINATSLGMYLVQYNHSSGINTITFDEISGTGNKMKLGQGIAWDALDSETNLDWSNDGYEGGGHEITLSMYGDYNKLAVQQTNQGSIIGHDFDLHLAGDYNEVQIKQQGNGSKDIDLTIYNDYNDVFIRQKGTNNTHTANITLDGLYGTDFTLKQFGSSGSQSYTISIDCLNPSGCLTNVIQE